jgi:release factor glutamine methyltransferase
VAGCVAADEEAEEMLSAAPDAATIDLWAARREQGEPLAWITGRLRFCGLDLYVDPGVYGPRAQTDDLARRASAVLPGGGRAADLCTGTGAVACQLSRAVPGAVVVGTDIDPLAAACARRNGVLAVVGDLDEGLAGRTFDVVTAVAPYVPTGELQWLPADVQRYEPRLALDGGDDGLTVVRRLVAGAARILRPGGWLVTEIGGRQDQALEAVLVDAGFEASTFWLDDDGDLRGVEAQLGRAKPIPTALRSTPG